MARGNRGSSTWGGLDLITEIDVGVITGLVTVLVTQVAALPQPGVLTSVKLP